MEAFSSLLAMSDRTLLASLAKSRSLTSCGDTGTTANASRSSLIEAHPTYNKTLTVDAWTLCSIFQYFYFSEAYKHMKLVYYIHITVDVQWIELILCWFNKDFWTFHINSLWRLIGPCHTDLFSDWFILLLVYRYTCGVYPGVCTQVMETHVGTPETFHVCHIAVKALHITKILASH